MHNFKSLRRSAHLTQTEAAARLGVTQSAVSQWESGQARPALDRIQAIAALYKTTTEYVVEIANGSEKRSA